MTFEYLDHLSIDSYLFARKCSDGQLIRNIQCRDWYLKERKPLTERRKDPHGRGVLLNAAERMGGVH